MEEVWFLKDVEYYDSFSAGLLLFLKILFSFPAVTTGFLYTNHSQNFTELYSYSVNATDLHVMLNNVLDYFFKGLSLS